MAPTGEVRIVDYKTGKLTKSKRMPLTLRVQANLGATGSQARVLDKAGKMIRTQGIVHTIKDGIVIENAKLLAEVEKIVAKSKQNAPASNVITAPFIPSRP